MFVYIHIHICPSPLKMKIILHIFIPGFMISNNMMIITTSFFCYFVFSNCFKIIYASNSLSMFSFLLDTLYINLT